MPVQQDLDNIADILEFEIKKQLGIPRQSRGYYGKIKGGSPSAPQASKNLINSVNVYWQGSIEAANLELIVKMEDYWYWVNYGRKPGAPINKTRTTESGKVISYRSFTGFPPLKPIDKWVITKQGFKDVVRDKKGRFVKRQTLVYLIRKSIAQYGYAGTYFLDEAYAITAARITEELGETLGNWFLDLFDDF